MSKENKHKIEEIKSLFDFDLWIEEYEPWQKGKPYWFEQYNNKEENVYHFKKDYGDFVKEFVITETNLKLLSSEDLETIKKVLDRRERAEVYNINNTIGVFFKVDSLCSLCIYNCKSFYNLDEIIETITPFLEKNKNLDLQIEEFDYIPTLREIRYDLEINKDYENEYVNKKSIIEDKLTLTDVKKEIKNYIKARDKDSRDL